MFNLSAGEDIIYAEMFAYLTLHSFVAGFNASESSMQFYTFYIVNVRLKSQKYSHYVYSIPF